MDMKKGSVGTGQDWLVGGCASEDQGRIYAHSRSSTEYLTMQMQIAGLLACGRLHGLRR